MSSALCELLHEAEYFSMIKPNQKPCLKTWTFVPSTGFINACYRTWYGESGENLLNRLDKYITSVNDVLTENKQNSFKSLIIPCIEKSIQGIQNLLVTYKDRPRILSRLAVILCQLNLMVSNEKDSDNKSKKT